MTAFIVIVQEERHLLVEADSPEQIREWFDKEGPLDDSGHGSLVERHDRILTIETS